MLALAAIFGSSFILGFSGAMMPGPLLTATIGESTRRGPWAGPLLILGHGLLELALVSALLIGLAPLLAREEVFIGIAIGGSVFLSIMAWSMVRSLPNLSLNLEGEQLSGKHPILIGALLSLANPYWTLWWATVGMGYILSCREFGYLGVAVFFIGHILADLVWYGAVSLAVSRGKRFLSDHLYRWLIGFCAAFLFFFAALFFWLGLQKLLSG